jgi:hypothetical protein
MMTEHESELAKLIDLLARVGEECDTLSRSAGGVKRNALGFAFKLTGHGISALTLLRDRSALDPKGPHFLDQTSVFVLARAGWEAFLLFNWIFVAPQDDDAERVIRYRRWSIESPRARQAFEIVLEGQREQLMEEKKEIERALEEIKENPAFLRRSHKEQEEFLKDHGRWRSGFQKIAEEASISKIFARDHYSYLCDHAHSGWFSLESTKRPLSSEDEKLLCQSVAVSLAVAVANTISGLQYLFPGIKDLEEEDSRRVTHWVTQGQDPGK